MYFFICTFQKRIPMNILENGLSFLKINSCIFENGFL